MRKCPHNLAFNKPLSVNHSFFFFGKKRLGQSHKQFIDLKVKHQDRRFLSTLHHLKINKFETNYTLRSCNGYKKEQQNKPKILVFSMKVLNTDGKWKLLIVVQFLTNCVKNNNS